jgi:hypothetical protein
MSTIKTETLSTPSNATVPVDTVVNGTAKAWVNFNGTGTVAIRRAFNVASITDNATGDYTVNLTTAVVDTNGALLVGKSNQVTNAGNATGINWDGTAAFGIVNYEGGSKVDGGNLYCAAFS